ncbi:MAG: hypothetical protein CMI63_18500 [Parvularcula sp.]|nr:hypothetical protein [Parvularcula sp.]
MTTDKALGEMNDTEPDVHDEASRWFMTLRRAGARDYDLAAFEQWRGQSEAHAKAYADVESAWELMDGAAAAPEIVTARRDALSRARRAAIFRWRVGRRPRMIAIAASLAAAFLAAPLVLALRGASAPETKLTQYYETDIGETRVLTLADNSKISLDAKTAVDVDYTPQLRLIELRHGQAFFDVAKDPTRPFRVTAGGKTVVALGTAFNVELVNDEVFVTLVEGKVAVTDAGDRNEKVVPGVDKADLPPDVRELTPGQRLVADASGASSVEPRADISKITAWRRGKLNFEDEPLGLAIERMNRYSRISLVAGDEKVAALGVSGVFDTGDTEAFVEALQVYFGVRAERRADGSIVIHAPA